MPESNKPPVLSMGILITGNIVGAGILGLPINTGLAGFALALGAMLVMWLLMLTSARIIAGRVLEARSEDFDLPTLFGNSLGGVGRWGAILANLLILYGLLVAYLSGGASIIGSLFDLPLPAWLITLLFFCLVTGFTVFGVAVVRKGNLFLMALMWAAFAALIGLAAPSMRVEHLSFRDWSFLPSALPILVTAFHFHNIVPTVCRGLDWQESGVKKALIIGTGLGLLMNLVWALVVMGALPVHGPGQDTILYAFDRGLPATVPLSHLLGGKTFLLAGLLFAVLAISTSYLANGTALMGFMHDLTKSLTGRNNRPLEVLLAFGPPLVVTLVYPDLFLKSLNVVGGVGIAFLFGVLPALLALKRARKAGHRMAVVGSLVMLACFALVVVFEMCQETGLLRLNADTEHWTSIFKLIP